MRNKSEIDELFEDIDDLIRQAETEKTHFYTAELLKRVRHALRREIEIADAYSFEIEQWRKEAQAQQDRYSAKYLDRPSTGGFSGND